MDIRKRIMAPTVAIVCAAIAILLVAAIIIFSGFFDSTTEASIATYSSVAENEFSALNEQSRLAAEMIAGDDGVQAALTDNDIKSLESRIAKLDEESEVDFVTVTDVNGTVLYRSHNPGKKGDDVSGQANIQVALAGDVYTTTETGSEIPLSVRTGAPITDDEGNVIGAISTGYRMDANTFVDSVKALTNAEVTVFLGDERLSTTVENEDGTRAVGTQADAEISAQVLAGTPYEGTAQILGKEAYVKYVPVKSTNGDIIGMLFVGEYTAVKTNAMIDFLWKALLIAAVIIALAFLLLRKTSGKIAEPIKDMVRVSNEISEGDVDVEVKTESELKEIIELRDSFRNMVHGFKDQSTVLNAIADGDYSVDMQLRSDKDVVGKSIIRMLDNNNQLIKSIMQSSKEVSQGAQQVAQGSQELATGSTQQAAAVEEISASINEVLAQSEESTKEADNAYSDTQKAGEYMGKSMESMKHLTQAMQDIHESSTQIAGVIKLIDDIAFQTNILALNAAVEAARAGEAGKGFAVVADEVRNLAAKSAEAASQTSSLIEASVQKVQEGNEITAKTEDGLNAVGEIAGKNMESMKLISEKSRQQSTAIAEINRGVNQITDVTQANSATSQESAASSEEMSSQAQLLSQIVEKFKLRDN